MSNSQQLDRALAYHRALPQRIRTYLNRKRGIPSRIIDRFLLGYNGYRITIPIYDREGRFAFFRMAKDPDDLSSSPKFYTPSGAYAELYGWENFTVPREVIVVCEGEFDRLLLEARGFPAITSTGGAGTFKRSWADALEDVPLVYVCFDLDEAGVRGAKRVAGMVPHARIVELPRGVGQGGDVTDFFMRLHRTASDLIKLMQEARTLEPEERTPVRRQAPLKRIDHSDRTQIEDLKAELRIEAVVGERVKLQDKRGYLTGRCPFHDDKNPSFVVYPTSRRFHCFGCGESGDVISFVMRDQGVSFSRALTLLKSRIQRDE